MVSSFGRAAVVQSYPCDFIEVKTFWIRKHTACNEQGTCTTTSVCNKARTKPCEESTDREVVPQGRRIKAESVKSLLCIVNFISFSQTIHAMSTHVWK